MNHNPKISIITAVYNGADYLDELIQSVLAQDYPNFEHIIIDDGSTDEGKTLAVLSQYAHLKWWSRENKGQYATQNEGLDAADGDIICIISADDVFVSDTFKHIVELWQVNSEYDLIYGRTEYIDANGQRLPIKEINGYFPRKLIRSYLYLQHCSLFVSRRLIEEYAIRFNPALRHVGDWDWIIQLFETAKCIRYVPSTLSLIRVHPDQTTRKTPVNHVRREHQYILGTYGGSYWLYRSFKAYLNWHSRIRYGLYYMRREGVRSLAKRIVDWLRRSLSPIFS